MKNYQYKLIYAHISDPVPNSGDPRTTDWTNPSGGIGEFWEYYGEPGATPLIVNVTGFTGDVQQLTKSSSLEQGLQTNFSINCRSQNLAKLILKYRADAEWNVYVNDILIGSLPINTGLPVDIELPFTPNEDELYRLRISQDGDSGALFQIDELQFQFIDSTEEILTKNPVGWDDLGLSFIRNEIYHSVFRSYSLSLRFVKKPGGGGSNLQTAFYMDSISANVAIEISERDPQTNDYIPFYEGIIDFNPDRFDDARDWVEAGIIDSGKVQKFKAREEINFDVKSEISADNIAIDPFTAAPVDIIFTPIDIYLKLQTSGNFEDEFFFSTVAIPPTNPPTDYGLPGTWFTPESIANIKYWAETIDINEIGSRFQSEGGPGFAERSLYVYINDTVSNSIIYIDKFNVLSNALEVAMREFSGLNLEQSIYKLLARTYDSDDNPLIEQVFDTVTKQKSGGGNPQTESIVFDTSGIEGSFFTVPPDGKFTITIEATTNEASNWDLTSSHYVSGAYEVELNLTEISVSVGQTFVECFFPFEVFTRLIQLMTSETDTAKLFESNYIGRTNSEFVTYGVNGPGALDAVTTGWNLRDFPDRAFNVNLRDIFSAFFNVHSLGFGYDRINDVFYLEPIDQFYDSGYFMFDLGDVDELHSKPYKEILDSKINSGYSENGEYEDFQGVNEFNLQSEHSQVLPTKQTKEARSPLNYDSIGMELTRREQYSSNASKDTKFDENIFIVRTAYGYTYKGAPDLDGFEGIGSYYNVLYTPRENLIRSAGFYKSALWNHELRIKFIKAIKDVDIQYTNQNGDLVNEFDDLTGSDLIKNALFVPIVDELEGKFTPEMVSILNTNPHGFVRYRFDNRQYEGFLLTVEGSPYQRKGTYKFLRKQPTIGDNFIFEDDDNFVMESEMNHVFD